MPINSPVQLDQASIYSDLGSLDSIRKQGLTDEKGAIKKAAKEFEAFFMNMMLKSMRQASEVIGEDSLLGSQEEKMFVGMMDEQLSADLSQKGHLGIADMMLAQFNLQNENNDKQETALSEKELQQKNINELNQHRMSQVINMNHAGINQQSTHKKVTSINTIADDLIKPSDSQSLPKADIALAKIVTPISATPLTDALVKVKPEKKSLFNEISDFVNTLLPHAEKAAQALSIDPKLLIAQAALETGWGKHIMHDESGKPGFNLFGIKAGKNWSGDSIKINTLEVENQQFKKVNASFRKYESFSESFNDYVDFVKTNPRYQKAIEAAGDAKEYINQLQSSGYATDPNYASKIMRIFQDSIIDDLNIGTQ